MSEGELPIPKTQEDFARNFNDVISKLSPESKKTNEELISILERIVSKIQPSDFGKLKGMQIFPIWTASKLFFLDGDRILQENYFSRRSMSLRSKRSAILNEIDTDGADISQLRTLYWCG